MTYVRIQTRISVITFIIFVISLLTVHGQGMKYSRSEESVKNSDMKTTTGNTTTISVRDDTQIKKNNNEKEDSINAAPTSLYVKDKCEVRIKKRSISVFRHILEHKEPHFIQFHIKLSKPVNSTKDVFQPSRWYWTYGTASMPYQFLSWNLHYGIYSLGLLDYKTSLVPLVKLNIYGHCNLTLGTEDTSRLITKALIPVINFTSAPDLSRKYKENYFCYVSVRENLRNTIDYHASVYLLFPIIFFKYNCCLLKYNFTDEIFKNDCSHQVSQMIKWTNIINLNITLGTLIIAYCPILIFQLFARLGESDKTESEEHGISIQDLPRYDEYTDDENWIYANGQSPLTFFDVISFRGIGVDKRWPVVVSRLRRFICLLLAPCVIYIELLMYSHGIGVWKQGDKIIIKDFVDVGTPVGFLSFMGDASNRNEVFVPAFGGPIGISVLYFCLGFSYLVLPKCLKQIVENSLPNSDVLAVEGRTSNLGVIKSPLFFGAKDVIKLAQINVNQNDLEPGYTKCATLMRCNFYMLFTMQFWRHVYRIQTSRVSCFTEHMSFSVCLLRMLCIPVYILLCTFEILLCILYFGIPLMFFMVVMVRGGMKMIPYLRENNTLFSYLFGVRFTRGLGVVTLLVTILLFTYCVFLLIVGSFKFISQVITYCFVAVILYPSVSFGNLFLLIVIVYYIIRQLKFFSYNYKMLLYTAVDISKRVSVTPNHVACFKSHLILSNVEFANLREIEINGHLLDFSQNISMNTNTDSVVKIKTKGKCFCIPKDLYKSLIQNYRPVHTHVLSLILRVSILICCVLLFLSIMHDCAIIPEDQISEVLHVVFIIAVGAIPKLIESNLISHNNVPKEKIEKRYIEQSIVEYWTQKYNK